MLSVCGNSSWLWFTRLRLAMVLGQDLSEIGRQMCQTD
eukprot:TCALIF_11678-PA protein Name:"Protein of unknown function" AED:0.10 eAED:1.00 QI:37/0/0/1/0/0/2/131/37